MHGVTCGVPVVIARATRRLTAIDLLARQNKVEANGQVHEYEVESVIHGSDQISSTNLVKPVLVSE